MFDDFRDLVVELNRAGARFLIVGAHALSAHGVPKATSGLDLWVDPAQENAARVLEALTAFGAPLDALASASATLSDPECVLQLGVEPFRIDIMTDITGVTFSEAWPNRVEGEFRGVLVHFIGREDFLRNKRSSGGFKALADIEYLGEDL